MEGRLATDMCSYGIYSHPDQPTERSGWTSRSIINISAGILGLAAGVLLGTLWAQSPMVDLYTNIPITYQPGLVTREPLTIMQARAKDPSAPKKPLNAYLRFASTKREALKAKKPELSATEVLKELAKMWSALTDKEKKPFIAETEQDKLRYEKEMEGYVPPPVAPGEKARGKKKSKDPNAPKRPLTAYFYFMAAQREKVKKQNPDLKATEIATLLGKLWKELPEKEKKVYSTKSEADQKRYAKEMEEYVPPPPEVNEEELYNNLRDDNDDEEELEEFEDFEDSEEEAPKPKPKGRKTTTSRR